MEVKYLFYIDEDLSLALLSIVLYLVIEVDLTVSICVRDLDFNGAGLALDLDFGASVLQNFIRDQLDITIVICMSVGYIFKSLAYHFRLCSILLLKVHRVFAHPTFLSEGLVS